MVTVATVRIFPSGCWGETGRDYFRTGIRQSSRCSTTTTVPESQMTPFRTRFQSFALKGLIKRRRLLARTQESPLAYTTHSRAIRVFETGLLLLLLLLYSLMQKQSQESFQEQRKRAGVRHASAVPPFPHANWAHAPRHATPEYTNRDTKPIGVSHWRPPARPPAMSSSGAARIPP